MNNFKKKHNTTVVMVTHSPTAAEYGNTKIKLNNGRLLTSESNGVVEQLTY